MDAPLVAFIKDERGRGEDSSFPDATLCALEALRPTEVLAGGALGVPHRKDLPDIACLNRLAEQGLAALPGCVDASSLRALIRRRAATLPTNSQQHRVDVSAVIQWVSEQQRRVSSSSAHRHTLHAVAACVAYSFAAQAVAYENSVVSWSSSPVTVACGGQFADVRLGRRQLNELLWTAAVATRYEKSGSGASGLIDPLRLAQDRSAKTDVDLALVQLIGEWWDATEVITSRLPKKLRCMVRVLLLSWGDKPDSDEDVKRIMGRRGDDVKLLMHSTTEPSLPLPAQLAARLLFAQVQKLDETLNSGACSKSGLGFVVDYSALVKNALCGPTSLRSQAVQRVGVEGSKHHWTHLATTRCWFGRTTVLGALFPSLPLELWHLRLQLCVCPRRWWGRWYCSRHAFAVMDALVTNYVDPVRHARVRSSDVSHTLPAQFGALHTPVAFALPSTGTQEHREPPSR